MTLAVVIYAAPGYWVAAAIVLGIVIPRVVRLVTRG